MPTKPTSINPETPQTAFFRPKNFLSTIADVNSDLACTDRHASPGKCRCKARRCKTALQSSRRLRALRLHHQYIHQASPFAFFQRSWKSLYVCIRATPHRALKLVRTHAFAFAQTYMSTPASTTTQAHTDMHIHAHDAENGPST